MTPAISVYHGGNAYKHYHEIRGILPGETGENPAMTTGIAYEAVVWFNEETVILLPPTHIRPLQHWVALEHLEEIIEAVTKEAIRAHVKYGSVDKDWRIYICHLGMLAAVDLGVNSFQLLRSSEQLRFPEMREYIEEEISRQRSKVNEISESEVPIAMRENKGWGNI